MISRVTSYHLQLVVSPCSSMKAAKTGEDTKSSQSPSKDDLVLEATIRVLSVAGAARAVGIYSTMNAIQKNSTMFHKIGLSGYDLV